MLTMNLLQNVGQNTFGDPARQRQRLMRARMAAPWQTCLGRCHGTLALRLASSLTLPDQGACRIPHLLQLGPVVQGGAQPPQVQAAWQQWPLRRGSIDMIMLALDDSHLAELPGLLGEAACALGPDAWLLVAARDSALTAWCRDGMPACRGQGLVLRAAYWGDARRYTWLPPRWSQVWSASWQRWLPGAQWSVQLWQKETRCPILPDRLRQRRQHTDWGGALAPQARTGNGHTKDSA